MRHHLLPLLLLALTSRAELKTDIVFATAGGTNLTLDAFVPEGEGPFPTCILVHGGAWMNGTKTSYMCQSGISPDYTSDPLNCGGCMQPCPSASVHDTGERSAALSTVYIVLLFAASRPV